MGSKSIRVGLVGIGNCASSLVQGLTFYRDAKEDEPVPGLMHANLGGYHVGDIEISAAFDVAASKVGRDVAEAIYAAPNNTFRFANAPSTGVVVQRGRTLDGIGRYLREEIEESDVPAADVADVLRQTETDVLVSYLPVGSEVATRWYAEQALAAGCGFVNCIPVFIASDKSWQRKFAERGLPLIGDDIKSQVGATIVHRLLANLFRDRGCVSTGRTSSTLAAIPTFSICSSGNGSNRRKYPRPNLWSARWTFRSRPETFMWVRVITFRGSPTASSPIFASRARHSATFPSMSS